MASSAPSANSAENGMFSIGDPSEYVGGHIAVGIILLLEAVIPVALYYGHWNDILKDLPMNDWYVYSWKAMTYGGFIAFFVPFIFWCTSFVESNTAAYLYLGFVTLFGGIYGFYIIATTIIY